MLDAILAQSRNTALIVEPIAMAGLLLQKKHTTDMISGAMETVIGPVVFNIGFSTISGVVQVSTDSFNIASGIEGVTTQVEVATGLALDTYGTEVALVTLLGFVVNLITVKFIRFEAIFLTGQHFLYFACAIALILIANDLPMPLTVIASGILFGFCGAALPPPCQPFMNKVTGAGNLATGHFNCIGYAFSGYVGKLFGKTGKSTEEKKDASTANMSEFSGLFRGFIFSVALFMVILFYVTVIACVVNGYVDITLEKAGNDIQFIYSFLQGLQFVAGMSVLTYGVHRSIAEITITFVAISGKYILDSRPAVGCPTISPFASTAVLTGSVGAFVGGFAVMAIMIAYNSSVTMTPVAGIYFFSGGTYGIFENAYDGWKNTLAGPFIVGVALTDPPLIPYPTFIGLGVFEASFPNVDYNIIGAFLNWILGVFAWLTNRTGVEVLVLPSEKGQVLWN